MLSHWLIVTCIYFLWTCVQLSDSRPQDVTQETWNPITTSPRSISSPIVILQTTSSSTESASSPTSSEVPDHRQNKAANPSIRDSITVVANQLLDSKNVTLDTRTPPKIKTQTKNNGDKKKSEITVENSHAGVAVPMDEDDIKQELDETPKKVLIHRNHNKVTPTTDGGLSTWVLLSGQPTTLKPIEEVKANKTDKIRINNKLRPSLRKNATTTTTEAYIDNKPVNKIKASVLASIKEKSSTTTTKPTTIKIVKAKKNATTTTTEVPVTEENLSIKLPLEAKDGDLDLDEETTTKKGATTKKPPKATTVAPGKRKKNKNRRRKPNTKTTNGTKVATGKPQTKEKPISTQVYNYISREVLPTVGVGLVGLVVTAGLAGYFLYPFAVPVRRNGNYEINDRKDDKYYYNEGDYSYGGQSEEDVISKVIAGMPATSAGLQDYGYVKPTTENRYRNTETQNVRYRQSSGSSYPTYSASYSQDKVSYNVPADNSYYKPEYSTPPNYGSNVISEQQKETGYTVAGISGSELTAQKFVVGNIPKDVIVTPAAVPEHGPRSLKLRRKREVVSKQPKSIDDNEIGDDSTPMYVAPIEHTTPIPRVKYTTTPRIEDVIDEENGMKSNQTKSDEKFPTDIITQNIPNVPTDLIGQFPIIPVLKGLFIMKAEMGLALLQHMVNMGRYFVEMTKQVTYNLYNNRNVPLPANFTISTPYPLNRH